MAAPSDRGSSSTLTEQDASLPPGDEPALPALTILAHPDVSRIGERVVVPQLARQGRLLLSRLEPEFAPPDGQPARALDDPFLSRSPVTLIGRAAGITLVPASDGTTVAIGRAEVQAATAIGERTIDRGVPLVLGKRIVLLLHRLPPLGAPGAATELVGASAAMHEVRLNIARVADLDVPVLIRGETGTGKELVARAIHAASRRAALPCVSINMAGIPADTAASALFGHVRGAFTSAVRDHDGYFASADKGTLFLDEIGDAPPDVQALLLRTLETGEIQRLGSSSSRRVDVRLLAATDRDLRAAIGAGKFREPLYHRLAGYVIPLPPLRARLDDLARLFVHFLRAELVELGEASLLETRPEQKSPLISAPLMLDLLEHRWPGNVRELRNVVRQLAIGSRGKGRLSATVARTLLESSPVAHEPPAPTPPDEAAAAPPREAGRGEERRPISREELVRILKENDNSTVEAARALGVSRTTFNAWMARHSLRMARDFSADELSTCLGECGGQVQAAADRLGLSERALRLRLNALGIKVDE